MSLVLPSRVRTAAFAAVLVVTALAGACGVDPPDGGAVAPPDGGGTDAPPPPNEGGPIEGGPDGGPTPAPFGLDKRPANTTCKAPARPPLGSSVTFERALPNVDYINGLVSLTHIPGDRTRWFGTTIDGKIVTFPMTNPATPSVPTVVADIVAMTGIAVDTRSEGGLLGLAFHPKFAQNGHLYFTWTPVGPSVSGMQETVARITSTDGGQTWGNYTTIIPPFDKPALNHNAGTVHFGPDGFLYLSFGDGGAGASANSQLTTGWFGKIIRIDVDNPANGNAYGIPAGNPFKNGGGEPGTYAMGFRNPFRFSFDRGTGALWVGDVGEATYEEIDIVQPGGNYGWPCREGFHDGGGGSCAGKALVEPIFEYSHATYSAITGGIVYRGTEVPSMVGTYVFANFPSGIFALDFDPVTGAASRREIPSVEPIQPVDFAEDEDGELYVLNFGGRIYKLTASQPPPASTFPDRLSKTGCVDPNDPKKPAAAMIPYAPNASFWSDGAEKERWFAIPDGKTVKIESDGDFTFPEGTVFTKTFFLGGKRVETRLFVRHDDGAWAGYTYEWNDAETDALLLPSSKSKKVGAQTWTFPSRHECLGCHTTAAGSTLGLELGQLNGDFVYTSTNRLSNQLATFEHIGLFDTALGKPLSDIVSYPKPTGTTGTLDARARAWLHTNCAQCHRPGGPGRGGLDLRFGTALGATNTCNAPQLGDLGAVDARVIAPGAPNRSVLSLRPHALGANRMPPIASTVVDTEGLKVLDGWITGLKSCP